MQGGKDCSPGIPKYGRSIKREQSLSARDMVGGRQNFQGESSGSQAAEWGRPLVRGCRYMDTGWLLCRE